MEKSTWKFYHEVPSLFCSVKLIMLFITIDSYFLRFITFQHFDYFVNPAHADPVWFDTFSADNYLYTTWTHQDHKICLCLTPIFVVNSQLLETQSHSWSKSSSGKVMLVKSLDCIFHSYEWECSLSFWYTVFEFESMQVQLNGPIISIETKPSNTNIYVSLSHSSLVSDAMTQIQWTYSPWHLVFLVQLQVLAKRRWYHQTVLIVSKSCPSILIRACVDTCPVAGKYANSSFCL